MTNTPYANAPLTYLNKQRVDSISVLDRSCQYGDGFFTTLLITHQSVLNWSAHWRRLTMSANRLHFAALNQTTLLQHIAHAVQAFEQDEKKHDGHLNHPTYVVKVLISRGESGRGYAIPSQANTLIFIQISQAPFRVDVTQECLNFPPPMALQLDVCQTQISIQTQLAGIKHLNRLDSVLAQTEVRQKQQQEGIMLNALDQVICGTQSNLFMIKAQTLVTPKLELSGVEGTTRYQLSQLAAILGLKWQEADLTLTQLQQADELFLSNAVRGIMPIKQLEETTFATEQSDSLHHAWNRWQSENRLCLKDIK